jgi:hypothetical protein
LNVERNMSRYFFHINDGKGLEDDCGADLPDMAALKCYAMHLAGDILRDDGNPQLWSGEPWAMFVNDEADRKILTLRFSAEQHQA